MCSAAGQPSYDTMKVLKIPALRGSVPGPAIDIIGEQRWGRDTRQFCKQQYFSSIERFVGNIYDE